MYKRLLAATAVAVTGFCQADPIHVDGKGYLTAQEAHVHSFYNNHLTIWKSRLDIDTSEPIPSGSRLPRPFQRNDNPGMYWTVTETEELKGCEIHPGKDDDHYGNVAVINDPADYRQLLDIFYCDNNKLFIIKEEKVIASIDIPGGPEGTHPAFVATAPQLPEAIYLARGNVVRKANFSNGALTLDPEELLELTEEDESFEKISQRNFVRDYKYFDKANYRKYRFDTAEDPVGAQNGFSVYVSKKGEIYLLANIVSRYAQQFKDTLAGAVFKQSKLGPDGKLLNHFVDIKADTTMMNQAAVGGFHIKHDAPYGMLQDNIAKVHGKRPLEGDVSAVTSNALLSYKLELLGDTTSPREYVDCRGHYSKLLRQYHPCGVPAGVSVTSSSSNADIITGYKQSTMQAGDGAPIEEAPLDHFTAIIEQRPADLVKLDYQGAQLPVPLTTIVHGASTTSDYKRPRIKKGKKKGFREGSAMDLLVMDANGKTFAFDIGQGRADTYAPLVDGSLNDYELGVTPQIQKGFEIYTISYLPEHLIQKPLLADNGVTPIGDSLSKLHSRIPETGHEDKRFFDGVAIGLVFEDALPLPNPSPSTPSDDLGGNDEI